MSSGMLTAIVAVVAVAALSLILRRVFGSGSEQSAMPTTQPEPDASPSLESVDEADDESTETVAITSDGWAFVPDDDEVQLVPPAPETDDLAESMGRSSENILDRNTAALVTRPRLRALVMSKPGEHLDLGDFIGARIVRGSPSADPWRLEALGREGVYRSWSFETREGAEAALSLLDQRIVQAPLDEQGRPHPPGEDEYAAAAALTEAGVADLAMDDDDSPA